MSGIRLSDVTKHYRVLKRREGLSGSIRDLFSRNYTIVKAVDGISLSIEPGELVGFIGPNGAGKSTTIKMLSGVLEPSSGTIEVDGFVPYRQRRRYVQRIGIVFGQRTQLWWDLAVIESFKLLKEVYGIDDAAYARNLGIFDEIAGLKELYGTPVRNLSLGQRMLCDIAASFIHDPSTIFLDEPTIGLDVEIRAKVRSIIKELNRVKGATVLLSSHDVGDIESLARRIVLIDKGKILYDGPTEKFNGIFGRYRTLRLDVHGLSEGDIARLKAETVARAQGKKEIVFGEASGGWLGLSFDQDRIPLLELLNPILAAFAVKDIKVEEIDMEEVIRRVYEGALG
jgi:ABC-2 type transport system ATP-binding protein